MSIFIKIKINCNICRLPTKRILLKLLVKYTKLNENNHKGSFCLLMDVATGKIGQGLSECMLESDETYTQRAWLMGRLRNSGWILE